MFFKLIPPHGRKKWKGISIFCASGFTVAVSYETSVSAVNTIIIIMETANWMTSIAFFIG